MKYCPFCGAEMDDEDVFCGSCGKSKTTGSAAEKTSVRNPNVSPKSRLAATIMSGIGGAVGVHDFYLGNIFSGILKIVLFAVGYISFLIGYVQWIAELSYSIYYYRDAADIFFSDGFVIMLFGWAGMIVPSIWGFVQFLIIVTGHARDKNGLPITEWIVKN